MGYIKLIKAEGIDDQLGARVVPADVRTCPAVPFANNVVVLKAL